MVAFSTIIWFPHGLSLWKCDDFHISEGCFECSDGVGGHPSESICELEGQDRWMCVDRVKYTLNHRHKWMCMCLYSFMMLKMWAKYILEMSSAILMWHLAPGVMRHPKGAVLESPVMESSSLQVSGTVKCRQVLTSLKTRCQTEK